MEHMSKSEFMQEDGHGYSEQNAWEELQNIHAVYRDMLDALVASCIARKVIISRKDMEVAMEGVGEALADEADHALSLFHNYTYTPDDAQALIEKAHERLMDHFRVKPLDWSKTFNQLFDPEQAAVTRHIAIQNRLAAKGEI